MLTITFKTPLLMFSLFELSCCCHGFVLKSCGSCTSPAIIPRCFATENIIRGKTPLATLTEKQRLRSSLFRFLSPLGRWFFLLMDCTTKWL